MANQTPQDHQAKTEDQRTDLQAMLAAARELGPEMDESLVDSYLAREKAAQQARGLAPVPGAGQPTPVHHWNGLAVVGVILAVVALGSLLPFLFFGVGEAGEHHFFFPWFVFLPLLFVFLGRRGRFRSRRRYTYETEDGRRVTGYERTRGYGLYGPDNGQGGYGGYGPPTGYAERPGSGPYTPPSPPRAPEASPGSDRPPIEHV